MSETLYDQPLDLTSIDVTEYGLLLVIDDPDLLAQILAKDQGCEIRLKVEAVCDKLTGKPLKEDPKVHVNLGCKGSSHTEDASVVPPPLKPGA